MHAALEVSSILTI